MEGGKKGSSCTTNKSQKKTTQHLDNEMEYKNAKKEFLSLAKKLMDRLHNSRDVVAGDSIGMRVLELLQHFPSLASENLCRDNDGGTVYPLLYFVASGTSDWTIQSIVLL